MKLSIVIISFQSEHLLKKLLKNFPKKHQIIIVENSQLKSTKSKIEKKFKNTKVIIPKENLGYAKAFNLALKNCKNDIVLTLTPDVIINKNLIHSIEKLLNSFKNFTLIAPEYRNQNIYKNFSSFNRDSPSRLKKVKNFIIENVKEIDWCFCIINKKKFKSTKILDENYFMYFETIDLCNELMNKNHKMYVIKNLNFEHIGTGSTKKKYVNEILINRNWHFSWSKFYFFKKNFNFPYALKKVIPNIYQSLLGIIASIFRLNFFHLKLHAASLSGIFNSIFLKKSLFRPKLK